MSLTTRDIRPFDKRLGVSQELYEKRLAELSNRLIANGYQIVVCSTCTGIESYSKDDRMVGLRIQKSIAIKDKFFVVMDELNKLN